MTREEAIQALNEIFDDSEFSRYEAWYGTAMEMAIEALSADAVSDAYKRGFEDCKRAYEIELARSADRELANLKEEFESVGMTKEEAIRRLKNMAWLYGSVEREPHIEAIDMAIEALQAVLNCQKCAIKELWEETEKEDLVSVVRCKDCRHQRFYINDKESFYCDKSGIVNMHIDDGDGEFFCKYGERR